MFAGMILLFAVSGVLAQETGPEAVIRELNGTVELQRKDSEEWEKAVQGQIIIPDTIISTGFKSNVIISVGESIISVRPLTRLSFREIRNIAGTETISVSLQAGRVQADVTQPSGTQSSFSIQSPSVTASTRGTVFEMSVYELVVLEGTVEYLSGSAAPVLVDAVGYSFVNTKTGRAVPPGAALKAAISPDMPIGNDVFNSFDTGASQSVQNVEVKAKINYN